MQFGFELIFDYVLETETETDTSSHWNDVENLHCKTEICWCRQMKFMYVFWKITCDRSNANFWMRCSQLKTLNTSDYIITLTASVELVVIDTGPVTGVPLTRPSASKPTALTHVGTSAEIHSSTLCVALARRLTCRQCICCSGQPSAFDVGVHEHGPALARRSYCIRIKRRISITQ